MDLDELDATIRELEDRFDLEPSEEIEEAGRTVAHLQD